MTPASYSLVHAISTDMMAGHINSYVENNDMQHIYALGSFLTQQRKSMSQDYAWEELLQNLKAKVKICSCICLQHKKSVAFLNAVMQVAQHMQPGQDCTNLLISRIKQEQSKYNIETEKPATLHDNWDF